jgi:hypothetical protein
MNVCPGRREQPPLIKLMARRKRKTLAVCRNCHTAIHAGRNSQPPEELPLESGMPGNEHVPLGPAHPGGRGLVDGRAQAFRNELTRLDM